MWPKSCLDRLACSEYTILAAGSCCCCNVRRQVPSLRQSCIDLFRSCERCRGARMSWFQHLWSQNVDTQLGGKLCWHEQAETQQQQSSPTISKQFQRCKCLRSGRHLQQCISFGSQGCKSHCTVLQCVHRVQTYPMYKQYQGTAIVASTSTAYPPPSTI